MSDLLDLNFNDYVEPTTVDANTEVELQIIDAKRGNSQKTGNPYIMIRLEIVGDETAKDILHFLMLPHDEMSKKDYNRCMSRIAEFFDTFDIPKDRNVDPEDFFPGQKGWAILGKRTNDQGEEENTIKKLMKRV